MTSTFALHANRTITVNNGTLAEFYNNNTINPTIAGKITGSGGVNLNSSNGGFTYTLSNTANDFQGPLIIWRSIIDVKSLADSATANGAIRLGLQGDSMPTAFKWTGNSPLVLNYRQIELVSNHANGVQLDSSNGTAANSITVNTDLVVTTTGNKKLTLQGSNTGNNIIAGRIVDGRVGATAVVVSLTKAGAGIWILSGTNTYTGATTVSAGTLLVNGDQSAATESVSVSSGATLGGTGTIGGAVTVADGGILSPGSASASTLTISKASTTALALNPSSVLAFTLGTASDKVVLSGASADLTLDGTLNVTQGAGFAATTYLLMTYTGTLTNNGLTIDAGFLAAYPNSYITAAAGEVTLHVVGAASKLAFTTQPSASTVAGVAFATQPVVTVQDAVGNTVTTPTNTIALTLTTGTGTLGGTASMDAVAGVADFVGKGLNIDLAGTDKVLAAATAGLTSATTSPDFTITPDTIPITVTAVTGTKMYDGTTNSAGVPTITAGALAAGDVATWTQTFDTKNVGINRTLTPAGTVRDGSNNDVTSLYTITFVPVATGTITPRPLTVTATDIDKIYDGTVTATVDLHGNHIGGDTLTFNDSDARFNDPNVGINKPVTVTGITIGGADAGNYDLQNTTAFTTANITRQLPVIVSQPASTTRDIYDTAFFAVTVMGTPPLTFQWRKNGVTVTGANGASYTTPMLTAADNGAVFSVVVSNAAGTTVSNGAVLTVNSSGDGLMESRYSNPNFSGTTVAQVVPNVNTSGVLYGNSIRWTGFLLPVTTGTYMFYARTTGGVRLWLDGTLVINAPNVTTDTTSVGSIALTTGRRYVFKMEFVNCVNSGLAVLQWGLPGWGPVPGGPAGSRVVVPQSQFFSGQSVGSIVDPNATPRATTGEGGTQGTAPVTVPAEPDRPNQQTQPMNATPPPTALLGATQPRLVIGGGSSGVTTPGGTGKVVPVEPITPERILDPQKPRETMLLPRDPDDQEQLVAVPTSPRSSSARSNAGSTARSNGGRNADQGGGLVVPERGMLPPMETEADPQGLQNPPLPNPARLITQVQLEPWVKRMQKYLDDTACMVLAGDHPESIEILSVDAGGVTIEVGGGIQILVDWAQFDQYPYTELVEAVARTNEAKGHVLQGVFLIATGRIVDGLFQCSEGLRLDTKLEDWVRQARSLATKGT